jgi:regulator of protease activity HflC (stomatin/prohibitin superfamily)
MITEREMMGHKLQKILDEKTTPWASQCSRSRFATCASPQSLENAISQQAQAERERQARVILGDAEVQASEKFAEAARVYESNAGARTCAG